MYLGFFWFLQDFFWRNKENKGFIQKIKMNNGLLMVFYGFICKNNQKTMIWSSTKTRTNKFMFNGFLMVFYGFINRTYEFWVDFFDLREIFNKKLNDGGFMVSINVLWFKYGFLKEIKKKLRFHSTKNDV